MPDKRFIFVPFGENAGADEGLSAAEEWDTHSSNKATNVYRASMKGDEKPSPWFMADSAYTTICYGRDPVQPQVWSVDDVIYVLGGHSAPGLTIMTTTANFQKYDLEGAEVARRLVQQFGLTAAFIGQVKLYTCNGTEPQGLVPLSFGYAFVQTFKTTCPDCQIFAYAAKVEQRHDTKFFGQDRKRGETTERMARAKEFRHQIYPL